MKNKTAYIISCFNHYHHRLHVVDDYLRSCGYKTVFVTSDFDHMSKNAYVCQVPGCVQMHTMPYYKNLSIRRILSHRMFAGKVFQYLEKLPEQPDVLVAMVPPNFVSHYMRKYKKRHPQVKLIFDIFDLWPETFPSGKAKKLLAPVFSVWAWLRNHSLGCADYITTECDLFRQRLKLNPEKSATVYLCAEPLEFPEIPVCLREDGIDLCYLGSINNIISIPDICKLIAQLSAVKPVSLHIIGKGERQQELMDSACEAGAEVIFHGAVYDEAKKQEIMSRCHFGLNIMKSSVCVGLTMKSVDYFRHGLPIINNIPADTEIMVKERAVGIRLDENAAESILALTADDMIQMRENVKQLFDQQFRKTVITNQLGLLLDNMLA